MNSADGGHHADAVVALADRRYDAAGDAYTRAAWRTLATPRPGHGPFDDDEKGWVGRGLEHLVTSAACYRVAGRPERAAARGIEGRAVAHDLRTALTHPAQRACLQEIIADCHVAGDLDGAADAYADAEAAYREAAGAIDDPRRWGTTPLFEAAAAPLQQVARSTADGEIAVAWEDLHGPDPAAPGAFLAHRAAFKRQRLPALLATVVEDGYLAAPRGTTEYGNATHECPACGSSDVNWIADSTLCLRCSRPTERR
ncbi:MAG: hypothetical protein ABEI11_01450 [Haloarculaceae archaeon]